MKCVKGYEVEPQRSAVNCWYMGTRDEEGFPNCKISSGYAKTAKEAERLPLDRQNATENEFCNGCEKCFK